MSNFIVATIHPWNIKAFNHYSKTLTGNWHLITDKDDLTIEIINKMNRDVNENYSKPESYPVRSTISYQQQNIQEHEEVEEILSLEEKEKEMIAKALDKHRGKRKYAAKELGISERTLYRKIKEYGLK